MGNLFSVWHTFVPTLAYFCTNFGHFYVTQQIIIVVNGQILNCNIVIWSHWASSLSIGCNKIRIVQTSDDDEVRLHPHVVNLHSGGRIQQKNFPLKMVIPTSLQKMTSRWYLRSLPSSNQFINLHILLYVYIKRCHRSGCLVLTIKSLAPKKSYLTLSNLLLSLHILYLRKLLFLNLHIAPTLQKLQTQQSSAT